MSDIEQILVPPPIPESHEIERATRPMRWLLEQCADGITLTQSGYLPPALVAEAVTAFDWWPFGGRPRSEIDVIQLELLRITARRLGSWSSGADGLRPRAPGGEFCPTPARSGGH